MIPFGTYVCGFFLNAFFALYLIPWYIKIKKTNVWRGDSRKKYSKMSFLLDFRVIIHAEKNIDLVFCLKNILRISQAEILRNWKKRALFLCIQKTLLIFIQSTERTNGSDQREEWRGQTFQQNGKFERVEFREDGRICADRVS